MERNDARRRRNSLFRFLIYCNSRLITGRPYLKVASNSRATFERGIANSIHSIDDKRQVVPVVYYTDDQGKQIEYVSSEIKATKQQLDAGEHRSMDCVDCHNRPTHAFDLPENAVNRAMAGGQIGPELPYIRKEALELLKVEYPDREAAKQQITEGINTFYRTKYPPVYDSRRALVQQAATSIGDIYLRNIFPEMKMTWVYTPTTLATTILQAASAVTMEAT